MVIKRIAKLRSSNNFCLWLDDVYILRCRHLRAYYSCTWMYASAHESSGDATSIKTGCELVKDRQYLTRHTVEDVFSSLMGLRYRMYRLYSNPWHFITDLDANWIYELEHKNVIADKFDKNKLLTSRNFRY